MTELNFFTELQSPLGPLLVISNGDALTGLYFEGQKARPLPNGTWRRDAGPFEDVQEQLEAYFARELERFKLRLAPRGTEFQRQVWSALRRIAYGKTDNYSHLAQRVRRPVAVRAVGAAVGRNPISIVIPCHRVIGLSGGLTGYAGGLDRKEWLLRHERG